ncbi:12405_t:CDS:2 [Funneliformis geosporum]|nr:12405_t:CDS:2 [Funneliformis geosporum]
MAKALVEKASKLSKPDNSSVRACAYYGDIDEKQRQKDFFDINVIGHFDIVIAITNIATPVHKNSNELFRPPGCENIRAELANARPNNLPTSIKGHCEWDSNAISYKIDESPAVITFIEVEHHKRLFARYFIEKLCSLIASTGASLQLIKMDESREVIGNRKKVRNEQGYNEKSAMKGLEAKDIAQWEDTYYKAGYNSEKSSRAKEKPDLKSVVKAINAITSNWCRYTVENQHGITSSKLRKIGTDHASRIYGSRNDSHHQYLRKLACRQIVSHYESVESYSVMNDPPSCNCSKEYQSSVPKQSVNRHEEVETQMFRLDKQNAGAYKALSGKNRMLKKQLEDYHSQYNTLERRRKKPNKE